MCFRKSRIVFKKKDDGYQKHKHLTSSNMTLSCFGWEKLQGSITLNDLIRKKTPNLPKLP